MARARNIKPGFYANEDLAECSIWARFIFPGLWMMADREGRLEYRPMKIKGELLRFDNIDAEPLIAELEKWGFVQIYEVDGRSFIQILKFSEHQHPHFKESESVIPPPPSPGLPPLSMKPQATPPFNEENSEASDPLNEENSEADPALKGGVTRLIPDSGYLIVDTGANAPEPPSKARTRKSPLPNDFEISDRVRKWATEKGHDRLDDHFDAFVAKAKAKGYAYVDWDAAFMEAIRGNWAKLPEVASQGGDYVPVGPPGSTYVPGIGFVL